MPTTTWYALTLGRDESQPSDEVRGTFETYGASRVLDEYMASGRRKREYYSDDDKFLFYVTVWECHYGHPDFDLEVQAVYEAHDPTTELVPRWVVREAVEAV